MNNITSTSTTTPRPENDINIAQTQQAASAILQKTLSPFEARMEKAFAANRKKPVLRGFCNMFERNLTFELDQQCYVWGDRMRMNTRLIEAIESSALDEAGKNEAAFWAILFHATYFMLGYQIRLAQIQDPDERSLSHVAFSQAVLQQMVALGVDQPANADLWTKNNYTFFPLLNVATSARVEDDILDMLKANQNLITQVTQIPGLSFEELQGALGQMAQYQTTTHEVFAQEMLNDWVAEFSKCNTFGEGSSNGIRLMYFKSKPPRDASEALLECLQSEYPVADDLALYNVKKLANDYYAPRAGDPVKEKTGHIEIFVDCSGSISAGDIADMMKVATDFFAKRKKKMTYGINTFDTSCLSRIVVGEDEDPVQKLKQLAILGGGGTDFRCTAQKVQDLIAAGDPGPDGKPYRCDMAIVCTDLAGMFPDVAPCDYVWVTTTQKCNMGAVTGVAIPGTVIYL